VSERDVTASCGALFHVHIPVAIAHASGAGAVRVGNAVVFNGVAADCRRVMQRRGKPELFTLVLEGGDRLLPGVEPAPDADLGTGDLIDHCLLPFPSPLSFNLASSTFASKTRCFLPFFPALLPLVAVCQPADHIILFLRTGLVAPEIKARAWCSSVVSRFGFFAIVIRQRASILSIRPEAAALGKA